MRKEISTHVQEVQRVPGRDKEKVLKETREKRQITYKESPISLTADLSAETLQARREWHDIFKVMKGKNLQSRVLYPASSHSDLTEKSKALQTSKTKENSASPDQLCNKC